MEGYNNCSWYLDEDKEYKCIQCGKTLDKDKGYCNNICFEAHML